VYLRTDHTLMACHLSVRYEENELNAVPDMLYHINIRANIEG